MTEGLRIFLAFFMLTWSYIIVITASIYNCIIYSISQGLEIELQTLMDWVIEGKSLVDLFCTFNFLIVVEYNVMLVSGVQYGDSSLTYIVNWSSLYVYYLSVHHTKLVECYWLYSLCGTLHPMTYFVTRSWYSFFFLIFLFFFFIYFY